jgi:hypothetical protein
MGGVICFYDSFVVNQSEVLRLKFCDKNPPLRQAEKRYTATVEDDTITKTE